MRILLSCISFIIFISIISCSNNNVVEPPLHQNATVEITNLNDTSNTVDYLVICNDSLHSSADSYCLYRKTSRQTGIDSAAFVRWSTIKDQFGSSDVSALKSFLLYAFKSWKRSPTYVLLLGGDTTKNGQCVPVIDTLISLASDNYFSDPNGDGTLDYNLGRIPVENNIQALAVLEKIKTYEAQSNNQVAFIIDDTCQGDAPDIIGEHFYQMFLQTAQLINSSGLKIDSLVLSQYGLGCNWDNSKTSKARTDLFSLLNKTNGFVNLIGHTGENIFTDEKVLVSSDTSVLTTNHVYVMGSNTGNFSKDCLSKSLLLKENSGAVAVVANSGMTYLNDESDFHKYFYTFLSQKKYSTIGKLFNATNQEFVKKNGMLTGMKILLGDPAMKIAF